MMPATSPGARLYQLLLRAYPRRRRAQFADGMRYAFAHELSRVRAQGPLRLAAFWTATIVTTLWFGLATRLDDARERARHEAHSAQPYGVRGESLMRDLFHVDWRDAWRSLRGTPLVTTVAVLSLALGIGANTALFSILNSLILKTLPVKDPQQLVLLQGGSWTNPIWEAIRARETDLAAGAFAWSDESFDLSQGGPTDVVNGLWASGRMFELLGVPAFLGRTLTPADDVRGGGRDGAIAVISYGFWQRRFGGAADVVGKTLAIARVPFTIVGVTGPDFFGPVVGRAYDVAIPLGLEPVVRGGESFLDGRSTWWLDIMARLEPEQTIEEATARLRAAQPHIREATLPPWRADMQAQYLNEPLTFVAAATGSSWLRRRYEEPLTAILIVVGLVLLIACANIANLLLARAVARRREMSVRLALGASRVRLARQLLAESIFLSAAGALVGLALAAWGSRLLVRQLASWNSTVFLDLSFDWRVLGFTLTVAAVTTILFGLVPALAVSSVAPNEALKEQGRGVSHDRRFGFRNALVVLQVALSLTLVVAAGLFARTFHTLTTRHTGLTGDPVLLVNANVRASTGSEQPQAQRRALYEQLRQAAASVPGVSVAATSFTTPLSNASWNTPVVTPASASLGERERMSWVNAVSPGWFEAYGIRLVRGRDFQDGDRFGGPPRAIVNRAFANRFFDGADPVGQRFTTEEAKGESAPFEIVGLVEDAVYRSLRAEMMPTMYIPIDQWDRPSGTVSMSVRLAGHAPPGVVGSIALALGRVDPQATLTIRSLSDQIAGTVTQERLVARMALFFGGLALLLAGLGLYGVTAYGVNRRRVEIGIRMALGADAGGVVRLVLRRVVVLVLAGVAIGAALSWWAAQFVATLLYGLQPRDPGTFAGAAAILAAIGLVAGWLPARRAARIDPTTVLREG